MQLEKEKAEELNRVNQIVVMRLSQMQYIPPYKYLEKDELKEDLKFIKEQLDIMEMLIE
jgi:hypothetical protein